LAPIPNPSPCSASTGAREPISVAIPFDLSRKKGAMMQKASVSRGKAKMDKLERRRELPCVRRSRLLYNGRVVRTVVPMSFEGKSDEEWKKKRPWK
jgi:hypothetical protein